MNCMDFSCFGKAVIIDERGKHLCGGCFIREAQEQEDQGPIVV
jgi:hypothetical protein